MHGPINIRFTKCIIIIIIIQLNPFLNINPIIIIIIIIQLNPFWNINPIIIIIIIIII